MAKKKVRKTKPPTKAPPKISSGNKKLDNAVSSALKKKKKP
jgi:hypothetical protein